MPQGVGKMRLVRLLRPSASVTRIHGTFFFLYLI